MIVHLELFFVWGHTAAVNPGRGHCRGLVCPVGGGRDPKTGPTSHPQSHSRAGMKGSLIPSSPAAGILNSSAKRFGGVTIEAPFPCLSFPHFPGCSPELVVPNPAAQSDPDSPRGGSSVENSAPSSSCFPLLFQRTGSAFPEGKRSWIPPPHDSPLERRRAGGWKAGSWSPCPPSQHGKSRGTLCFQETAAPPAKKHEPEQSPTIFGLETILSPERHRGGCVTLGLPTSHTELSSPLPLPTKGSPNPGNEGWDDAVRTTLARTQLPAWTRRRREFLRRGFQRFSINSCTKPGTIPPPRPPPNSSREGKRLQEFFPASLGRLYPRC